jgi:hypothetical protein
MNRDRGSTFFPSKLHTQKQGRSQEFTIGGRKLFFWSHEKNITICLKIKFHDTASDLSKKYIIVIGFYNLYHLA